VKKSNQEDFFEYFTLEDRARLPSHRKKKEKTHLRFNSNASAFDLKRKDV
jgi:hypothetical protein